MLFFTWASAILRTVCCTVDHAITFNVYACFRNTFNDFGSFAGAFISFSAIFFAFTEADTGSTSGITFTCGRINPGGPCWACSVCAGFNSFGFAIWSTCRASTSESFRQFTSGSITFACSTNELRYGTSSRCFSSCWSCECSLSIYDQNQLFVKFIIIFEKKYSAILYMSYMIQPVICPYDMVHIDS